MKPLFTYVSFWFGLIMIVLVFAGTFAFAFTNFMDDRLFGPKRIAFVFILLAYGIYRIFRLYQLFRETKKDV